MYYININVAFQKAYFEILFFFTKERKESKEGKPRIEFSPANKKKEENVFYPTHRIFSRE